MRRRSKQLLPASARRHWTSWRRPSTLSPRTPARPPSAPSAPGSSVPAMLSAETQITNLLFTYAERIDAGDIDGVADLFAHALLTGGDGSREAQGRDGALKWFGGGEGSRERHKTKHVTTNVIIELDDAGTRAQVRSVYHVLLETDD